MRDAIGVPPPPGRDSRLDALRGALQLIIFASHSHGSFIGAWLIPAAWGLSDSSQQFVFLSGLALGSVFARKRLRTGFWAASLDLLRRAVRLWRTHLVVFGLFALMVLGVALATGDRGELMRQGFAHLMASPWRAAAGAAAMLYQPEFMGILPVFVWCMLLLPGFMWLLGRVGDGALLAPVGLWAGVQAWGWAPPALGDSHIAFNPFAWQILFLGGAWLGRRMLLGGGPLASGAPRVASWLTWGSLAMLAAGVVVMLLHYGVLAGAAPDDGIWRDKRNLGLPTLLHSFACAWLAVRLLPAAGAMIWSAGWSRQLGRIGRHSLTVFCVGLFLAYGAATVIRLAEGARVPTAPFLLDIGLVGGGVVMLWALSLWLDRPARVAKPPAARPAAIGA
ncbi:OpgC family protein [Humitalea sp. 24SJ18S-53]|uniref:OpgC family protein n=1 Tax=Humitalea sp. 24SJ18S-53 TaxID=3422307 RepID=UPI003D67B361